MLTLMITAVAHGGCAEPTQTVQVEARTELQGQVRATVMGFGGSASGERETATAWQSQLPSQQAIDNQWYLYYLCREYESGHMTRHQYCTVSASLWERITGIGVPVESCLSAPSDPLSAVAAPVVQASFTAPAPVPVAPAQQAPAHAISAVHWQGLVPGSQVSDMYGPVDIAGISTWFFDNNQGCISTIAEQGGRLQESMLIGAGCTAWSDIAIEASASRLILVGDGMRIAFDPAPPGGSAEWDGVWGGALNVEVVSAGRADRSTREGSEPLQVRILPDGTALTTWEATGCRGALQSTARGSNFRAYTEDVSGTCVDGATITLTRIGPDALLAQWIAPNVGSRIRAVGILRRN